MIDFSGIQPLRYWAFKCCLILAGLLVSGLEEASARTWDEIRQSGQLRICVAGSSAPFYRVNGEAFAKYLELQPEVTVFKQWDQQFQNQAGVLVMEESYVAKPLADGSCDVFPNDLHALPWRASKMALVPYYTTRKVVVAHRDQKSLRAVEDLQGRSATVQKGTAYDTWLKDQNSKHFGSRPVQISYLPTAEAMAAVANKKADFTVVGAESSFKWVRGNLDALDILFPVDDPVQVAWGIHPQTKELRSRLEQFFKDSKRVDSALDRSWREQYGVSLMEYQLFEIANAASDREFWRWLIWSLVGSGILLALVMAVLVWNRRLKHEIAERVLSQARSQEMSELIARRDQQSTQVGQILLKLQGVSSYAELDDTFLPSVATLFELGQASIYRADNGAQRLTLCSGYARTGNVDLQQHIAFGAGLLGQCALDQQWKVISAPPPDYLVVSSGLATVVPVVIVLVPVLGNTELLGVIEMASLKSWGDNEFTLLKRLLPMTAMSMEILARNAHTQSLLQNSQQQAQALELQQGEITRLLTEQETIFQNAPHGVIYTEDNLIFRANRWVAHHFGLAVGEIIGKPVQILFPSPENFLEFHAKTDALLATGRDVHLEWQFANKEGTPFFVRFSGQGIALEKHTKTVVWSLEDITERWVAEARLAALEERSRLILSSVSEGLIGLDSEGRVTFVNPAATTLLGYREDELLEQKLHPLVHHTYPDGREFPRHECSMYLTSVDGQARTVDDEVLWHKNGSAIAVEYTTTPIYKDNVLVGTVAAFRDISGRKKVMKQP